MRDKPAIDKEYCSETGKKCYTKKDAQTVLNDLGSNKSTTYSARHKKAVKVKRKIKHRPVRIYPCPACNTWHLTAREKNNNYNN